MISSSLVLFYLKRTLNTISSLSNSRELIWTSAPIRSGSMSSCGMSNTWRRSTLVRQAGSGFRQTSEISGDDDTPPYHTIRTMGVYIQRVLVDLLGVTHSDDLTSRVDVPTRRLKFVLHDIFTVRFWLLSGKESARPE